MSDLLDSGQDCWMGIVQDLKGSDCVFRSHRHLWIAVTISICLRPCTLDIVCVLDGWNEGQVIFGHALSFWAFDTPLQNKVTAVTVQRNSSWHKSFSFRWRTIKCAYSECGNLLRSESHRACTLSCFTQILTVKGKSIPQYNVWCIFDEMHNYISSLIGTSAIVWAQLSRFYLKTETETSLRNFVFWNINRTVF
jgi:hypothetical protein